MRAPRGGAGRAYRGDRATEQERMAERIGGAETKTIRYDWSRTAERFHNSMAPYKGIMGPVGGGKSVMCWHELRYRSNMMPADPEDKVRRSRWLVIRNTYQELKKTTIKTILEWSPNMEMRWSDPIMGMLREPSMVGDGTTVEMEVLFYGLDKPEQARGLKGIECSGAWLNEACEIREEWLDLLIGRIGRYPRRKPGLEGIPAHGLGLVMDTNPPSDTSWWYRMAEVEKPEGWEFFRQPPAVLKRVDAETGRIWYEPNDGRDPGIDPAENIEHLGGYEYYMKQTRSGNHDYIKVFLMGEYGTTLKGMPVYPEYSDGANWAGKRLEPYWGLPIFLGTDFGRTPATVVLQVLPDGQIAVYDELVTEGMTVNAFVTGFLRPLLVNRYRFGEGQRIVNFGDPAGMNPEQTSESGPIAIMNQLGIPTRPAMAGRLNNSFWLRRESVAEALRARLDNGKAGLVLSEGCKTLREGMLGRYCYASINTSGLGDERYAEAPMKNMYSHVQDALQYAVYGATHMGGEGVFDLGAARRAGVGVARATGRDPMVPELSMPWGRGGCGGGAVNGGVGAAGAAAMSGFGGGGGYGLAGFV